MGKDFENPFGQKAAKSGRTFMMSELLDKTVIPGIQGGALMHVVAAKAVGFGENLTDEFGDYAAADHRERPAPSRRRSPRRASRSSPAAPTTT